MGVHPARGDGDRAAGRQRAPLPARGALPVGGPAARRSELRYPGARAPQRAARRRAAGYAVPEGLGGFDRPEARLVAVLARGAHALVVKLVAFLRLLDPAVGRDMAPLPAERLLVRHVKNLAVLHRSPNGLGPFIPLPREARSRRAAGLWVVETAMSGCADVAMVWPAHRPTGGAMRQAR